MGKLDKQPNALPGRKYVAWIFQSNPKRYRIDDYLRAHKKKRVYWGARQHAKDLKFGDRVFIWRAKGNSSDSGVIASGKIVEEPVEASRVKYRPNLGDKYWKPQGQPQGKALRVGIKLDSMRLTPKEHMILRKKIESKLVVKNPGISFPLRHTVTGLRPAVLKLLEKLWQIRP